ncbi:unnamed protein product [Lymnaea stagnalis]|uniref:CAF17 C-terminal domain-containing protein n=1 Tax=Lymnaea stagnalis TaxID=6523 RepID=A0AAV2H8X1_LYMST
MAGLSVFRCLRSHKHFTQIINNPESTCHVHHKISKLLLTNLYHKKNFHTSKDKLLRALSRLESRGVLKLSGKDTAGYLQGLVTNDVQQLVEKSPAVQYTMMLNVQGRVLYDLFLYNITNEGGSTTLLVDVDKSVKAELVQVLKRYRLRKKVDISDVSDQYRIWSQWSDGSSEQSNIQQPNIFSFHDPRVPMLARRIIVTLKLNVAGIEDRTEQDYRVQRFKLGIPEGITDLPPGNCLPLESNLDLMNGVNFQKGCYIGQELTARTYHTGVTRKRIMPIELDTPAPISVNAVISTKEKGKNAGKFRSVEGLYGLGLLRLEHIKVDLTVKSAVGETVSVRPHIPEWWPKSIFSV